MFDRYFKLYDSRGQPCLWTPFDKSRRRIPITGAPSFKLDEEMVKDLWNNRHVAYKTFQPVKEQCDDAHKKNYKRVQWYHDNHLVEIQFFKVGKWIIAKYFITRDAKLNANAERHCIAYIM